jgi:TonB family protein
MDRLQKKCAIGSTGVHLLLGLILFVGPAFLTSSSKPDNSQILDIVPSILVENAVYGGGNPKAKLAPAILPTPTPPAEQPQPKPQIAKVEEPSPPKEQPKTTPPEQQDADSLELKETKKKPQISLTPVIRKPTSTKTSNQATTSDNDKQLADRRRKAADMLASAARSLRDDVSSGITLDPTGPGGGGPVYAGYDQFVRSVYWHAWVPPEDTASENAVVKATVTIARDGNVLSFGIINACGDTAVDTSVRRTLERVSFIAPFPEGVKDKQRIYTIKFDLKAKRLNG